jgi:archaellum biogenesis ATPase FlaH
MYDSAGNRQQISSSDAAQDMLQVTKILNLRLNSVLEVMNYLAQSRVDIVNSNKSQIDSSNTNINNKLQKLNQSYKMLNQDNVIVNTQKASVLYTEEKNNYTTNQISVWAALNVIALATIFYVYRT